MTAAAAHQPDSAVLPWPAAVATGVGSMPGSAPLESARIIAGELAEFVHIPELPNRGPGADMVGRTGGLIAGIASSLSLETTPQGWRFTDAVGREMRRAQSFLGEDLDAVEETTLEYRGPLKSQIAGPWTLAAAIELKTGERALRDLAAVTDIAEALAEAVRLHVAELRRRVPNASAIVLQLDEPTLPAVLAGRIGTASGLSSYSAVDEQIAEAVLRRVVDAARDVDAVVGVHCCSAEIPIDLLRKSGAQFVSLDITFFDQDTSMDDVLGRAWEGGTGILAGSVSSLPVADVSDVQASAPLRTILHRLGMDDPTWLAQVAITPTCGLAGATPAWATRALRSCGSVGRIVRDDIDDEDREHRRRGSR